MATIRRIVKYGGNTYAACGNKIRKYDTNQGAFIDVHTLPDAGDITDMLFLPDGRCVSTMNGNIYYNAVKVASRGNGHPITCLLYDRTDDYSHQYVILGYSQHLWFGYCEVPIWNNKDTDNWNYYNQKEANDQLLTNHDVKLAFPRYPSGSSYMFCHHTKDPYAYNYFYVDIMSVVDGNTTKYETILTKNGVYAPTWGSNSTITSDDIIETSWTIAGALNNMKPCNGYWIGVGNNGLICRSGSRYYTPVPQISGTTENLYDAAVIDGNIVVVGAHGTMLISKDNGTTWTPIDSGTGETLYAIAAK
jgi:hypothetical protein